jgi:hypothetical protein
MSDSVVPDVVVLSSRGEVETEVVDMDNSGYTFLAPVASVIHEEDSHGTASPVKKWHQWPDVESSRDGVPNGSLEAYVRVHYAHILSTRSDATRYAHVESDLRSALILASVRAGVMNWLQWSKSMLKQHELVDTHLGIYGSRAVWASSHLHGASLQVLATSMRPLTPPEIELGVTLRRFGETAVKCAAAVRMYTGKYMPRVMSRSAMELISQVQEGLSISALAVMTRSAGGLERLVFTHALHAVRMDQVWAYSTRVPGSITFRPMYTTEPSDDEELYYM